MSSSASVRRLKERGGSGGKITPLNPSSKSQTPIPSKHNVSTLKNPNGNGKENPRSISTTRPARKPLPIPRIDKLAAKDGCVDAQAVRRSASSVPRGRSSSPSDFARLLSDRMSRVGPDRSTEGKSGGSGFKGLERSLSQKSCSNSKGKGSEGIRKGFMGLGDCKNGIDLKKNVEKVTNEGLNGKLIGVRGNVDLYNVESCKDRSFLDLKVKGIAEKALCDGNVSEEVVNGIGVVEKFGDVKGKGNGNASVEDNGIQRVNKYPSKLHEKLAFLEGKVKKIASDIKRTKDMLDSNNPDASKMILCDIQEKISGVEKAMGHVVDDNLCGVDLPKVGGKDSQKCDNVEAIEKKQFDQMKHSVKGLNHEELEARLFPHRQLIRSRTLGESSTSSETTIPCPLESNGDLNLENSLVGPIDENPIALEFLASLGENRSNVNFRNGHVGMESCEIQEMDGTAISEGNSNSNVLADGTGVEEIRLTADETIGEFYDDQENRPEMVIQEDIEDSSMIQLNEIGRKTSTGGWFVSEGESVLLAHDDGSCTFYDIANSEDKAVYKPPAGVSPNLWGDCWLIRAPGSDGSSGRYVVAASSGNSLESGFCVWDFYTKDVQAFHVEKEAITSSRTVLGPLPNTGLYRRDAFSTIMAPENCQWWYKPCGPLLVSTASSQRVVSVYDIRDGEQVLKWEVQRPVITMDYSSPLHWRNRGKVVIAETDAISLWDVNSLTPQALLSVPSPGRKVSALHINNTDAELGGGVRRRVSSSEVDGHDGVFCTQDTINVLDFRLPSGVGLKISKLGVSVHSIFSRGDSVFLGCSDRKFLVKEQNHSLIQQYSLRKGRIVRTYALPESNAHTNHSALSQVWGNSDLVMGVCGLGLFVFDALQSDSTPSFAADHGKSQQVRDVIGPDDLYSPSFDYLSSRVLVISGDRPALWRYLS